MDEGNPDQAGIVAWRLTLEYDGSRYRGWQAPEECAGCPGSLKRAAEEVLGVPVEIQGAGRTDAGVHALGQVAHLKAAPGRRVGLGQAEWLRLNQALPSDLVVLSAEPVPAAVPCPASRGVPPLPLSVHCPQDGLSTASVTAGGSRRSWIWTRCSRRRPCWSADTILKHRAPHFPSRPDESTIVVVEKCEWVRVGDELHFRIEASFPVEDGPADRRVSGQVGSGARISVEGLRGAPGREDSARGGSGRLDGPASGLFLESVRYGQEGKR